MSDAVSVHVVRPPRVRQPTNVRLWIPLRAITLVLSPLVLLALMTAALFAFERPINPLTLTVNSARLLFSLAGTDVLIASRRGLVHLSIF